MRKLCLQYVTWGGGSFILKHKRHFNSNLVTFFYSVRRIE